MLNLILCSILEGIAGFLMFIIIVGGFYWAFLWIYEKFFGVRVYGRFQSSQMIEDERNTTWRYHEAEMSNPGLLEEAKQNCKRKHYQLTSDNILSEFYKLKIEHDKK